MTDKLEQIFLDRRIEKKDPSPKRRWSDFESNRNAAKAGKPMPLNRPPRYKPEDVKFGDVK